MARIVSLAWLALALCVQAVTVGWKLPFHSSIPDKATSSGAVRLEKPPARSMFFENGDELWELSKAIHWRKVPQDEDDADPFDAPEPEPWGGDWVVWNSRSGMLIGSGSWKDIRRLEESLNLDGIPTIQRSRFEFVTIREGVTEPTRRSEVTVTGRDGEEAGAEIEGVRAKVTSRVERQHAMSYNTLSFSWPGREHEVQWELLSKFTAVDGNRTRIAKGRDGEEAWELFATISTETADGTPLNGERLIEGPAGLVPWVHYPTARSSRRSLEGDLVLGTYRGSEHLIFNFGGGDARESSFIDGPVALGDEVRGSYLDVRAMFEQNGAKFDQPRAWIGFDPRTLSVVAIADREDQDLIEGCLEMGREPTGAAWVETNPESGGWGLLCGSGEKGSISRTKEGESYLACDFEPTIGGNEQVVDLRFQFDVVSDREKVGRLHSASTLFRSRPQVVGSLAAADGKSVEVIVTVDIDPR